MDKPARWLRSAAVVLLAGCCCAQAPPKKAPTLPAAQPRAQAKPAAPPRAGPVKIASGRYELKGAGETGGFSDDWTLWKTSTGQRLVEQWEVTGPTGSLPVKVSLEVEMTSGQAVLVRVLGAPGNEMECRMAMNAARCTAGGQTSAVEVPGPYSFFLPSPWLLRAVVLRSDRDPGRPTPVKLVRMAGMSADGPNMLVHDAKVRYIGVDDVEAGGKRYACEVYELQPDPYPRMLIWLDRKDGIPVLTRDAKKADQRIELVQYLPENAQP